MARGPSYDPPPKPARFDEHLVTIARSSSYNPLHPETPIYRGPCPRCGCPISVSKTSLLICYHVQAQRSPARGRLCVLSLQRWRTPRHRQLEPGRPWRAAGTARTLAPPGGASHIPTQP